jgi:hypothetical protein
VPPDETPPAPEPPREPVGEASDPAQPTALNPKTRANVVNEVVRIVPTAIFPLGYAMITRVDR